MTDEVERIDQRDAALYYAIHDRNNVEARRLLEAGANANADLSGIISLLDVAMDRDDVEMARLLLRHGADANSALICAAYHPHLDFIPLLLEYGANPNIEGGVPLDGVITEGDIAAVRALIDAGVNVHLAGGEDGYTPLGKAAAGGYLDIVRLLIKHGVGINERDVDDQTALDVIDIAEDMERSEEAQQARKAVREFLQQAGGIRFRF